MGWEEVECGVEFGAQQLHLLSGENWLILSTLTSQLLRVARCFDPSFARSSMNEQIVRGFAHIVPIAHMVDDLLELWCKKHMSRRRQPQAQSIAMMWQSSLNRSFFTPALSLIALAHPNCIPKLHLFDRSFSFGATRTRRS